MCPLSVLRHATAVRRSPLTTNLTVKATDEKPIINKASVGAASPADPNLNNNTDTKTTNVVS
jgi:hypothetical protein